MRRTNIILPVVAATILAGCQPVDPVLGPMVPENVGVTEFDGRTDLSGTPPHFAPIFYPLRIGNTWRLDATARLEIIIVDGPPPPPPQTIESVVERRLIGFEELFGRRYVVEEEVVHEVGGSDSLFSWIRFRQDQKGLYEADVWIGQPPALVGSDGTHKKDSEFQHVSRRSWFDRTVASLAIDHRPTIRGALEKMANKRSALHEALGRHRDDRPRRDPGGVLDDELTRLQYPLRPGAMWSIGPNPQFVTIVEDDEVLELPAGRFRTTRLRIDVPDPNDRVHLWVGRCGRVKLSYHLETIAMDPFTGEIAIIVQEWDEHVVGVAIDVPGNCGRGR